jgi:hypothetical protein
MRGLARWIGAAPMAAVFAVPLVWMTTPAPHHHHHHHRPPAPQGRPVAQLLVPHTIAGRWSFELGDFDFVKTRRPGTYTDHVIAKRLGVFCSKVNDRNGQIVLHRAKNNWSLYTGTWQWFYPSTCQFAGYGRITVTLWQARPYAYFTAYPPKGIRNSPDKFRIQRMY